MHTYIQISAVRCDNASLENSVHRVWKLYQHAAKLDPGNCEIYVDFAGFVEEARNYCTHTDRSRLIICLAYVCEIYLDFAGFVEEARNYCCILTRIGVAVYICGRKS